MDVIKEIKKLRHNDLMKFVIKYCNIDKFCYINGIASANFSLITLLHIWSG